MGALIEQSAAAAQVAVLVADVNTVATRGEDTGMVEAAVNTLAYRFDMATVDLDIRAALCERAVSRSRLASGDDADRSQQESGDEAKGHARGHLCSPSLPSIDWLIERARL